MPLLETQNLSYVYSENTPFRMVAIDDVNISIEKGELVGIIGHTGSGKSTLVQHLNGLLEPTSGKVLLNGEDISSSKAAKRAARFRVGLCFQYPEYQLFESTVRKDIAFGPHNMGLSAPEIEQRVNRAAAFVGLRPEHMEKSPFDLSGGEKRRVAIAGVMAMEPEILILDEPTAGLDPRGRDTILQMLLDYRKTTGNTVVIVSHSMDDVAQFADRVIVMNGGKVEFCGSVHEVFCRVEMLERVGLDVPQVTGILLELHKRGLPVRTDIYTVEACAEELARVALQRGNGV